MEVGGPGLTRKNTGQFSKNSPVLVLIFLVIYYVSKNNV